MRILRCGANTTIQVWYPLSLPAGWNFAIDIIILLYAWNIVLVPGKKYPETGVILESEFCM